jgi:hypothetical protein
MGSFSVWHWVIVLIYLAVVGVPLWKITKKAGFSGWWSITAHIPLVNIIAIWVLALTKWPKTRP